MMHVEIIKKRPKDKKSVKYIVTISIHFLSDKYNFYIL